MATAQLFDEGARSRPLNPVREAIGHAPATHFARLDGKPSCGQRGLFGGATRSTCTTSPAMVTCHKCARALKG